MSNREAFFRAICAAPDDDAPRLVFADWLDENGDEIDAEYIRLQCRLARVPSTTSAQARLLPRLREIERTYLETWKAPFRPLCMGCDWRRGFVDAVQLTYRQFLENAAALVSLAPVRFWQFRPVALFQGTNEGAMCHAATHMPIFERVRSFELGYYGSDELLMEVTDSPYRTGLRGISVIQNHSDSHALTRFFESVPDLCELAATQTALGRLLPLWRNNSRHRLKRLEITHSKLTNELVIGMARSAALEELEALWLDGNSFDDRGLQALVDSLYLRQLRELSCADVSLGNEGAIMLAKSPILTNVRLLNLTNCAIDAGGCQALADSPYLEHLELLCLDRNRVSHSVEQELERRFGADRLSFGW